MAMSRADEAGAVAAATAARPPSRPDERNQRHAVRRRHAGAADHLHGGGAADDRRRADRPAGNQAKALNSETKPITISINQDGKVYLAGDRDSARRIVPKLQAIAKAGYEERIYVRGDKTADYGTVMKVMARFSRRRLPAISAL